MFKESGEQLTAGLAFGVLRNLWTSSAMCRNCWNHCSMFFQAFFQNCLSCIYNCDGLLSHSSHFLVILLSKVQYNYVFYYFHVYLSTSTGIF